MRTRCQAVQPPPLPRSALRRNTLGGSELVVSEVGQRPLAHVPWSGRWRTASHQAFYGSTADGYCGTQQVALGSMTWGKQNSQADAHAQLSWAADAGINFVVRDMGSNPNSYRQHLHQHALRHWQLNSHATKR